MEIRELKDRKFEKVRAAGRRWTTIAPDVARTAALLVEGGPRKASHAKRVAQFVARESMKSAVRYASVGLERIVGDGLELDDLPPDLRSRKAGAPIARLVEMKSTTQIGEGFATGFLIAPTLLLTNWHVFPSRAEAIGCGAQFGFERNEQGLVEPGAVFEIDADFFVADERLDIALVGLKPRASIGTGSLVGRAVVRLIATQGKILAGQPINIIQHPDGRHKHWAVRQNKLMLDPADDDLFLSYSTDTLPGSSGSPAFNYDWELVAVHHSGVPRMVNGEVWTLDNRPWQRGAPETDIDWIANEGARVSKIVRFLEGVNLPSASQQETLSALLVSSRNDPVHEAAGQPVLPRVAAVIPPQSGEFVLPTASMNITVHGTAHFYAAPSAAPSIGPAAPATGVSGAAGFVEKKLRFDPNYAARPGYQPEFFPKLRVSAPSAPSALCYPGEGAARVLTYHHYSLVMHKERRLALWTAASIDFDPAKRTRSRADFGTDTWKPDPRIPIDAQIEDAEFYSPAKKFDRGHLVRRDDLAWGTSADEEEFGNSDSFHWTNCTPQHEGFNRDMFQYQGLWGGLENHITTQAGFVGNKLILFAGPILAADDPRRDFGSGREVQVPLAFWKVVIAVERVKKKDQLRAYAFILDQSDAIEEFGWEARFRAGVFEEQQVALGEITRRTQVTFAPEVVAADPLRLKLTEGRGRALRSFADVLLRPALESPDAD